MPLTTSQLATLRIDINADPILAAKTNNDDGSSEIAAAYNLPATPAFRVWRSLVGTSEVKKNIVWTEFIGRSAGERDAFQFMLSNGTINPADANVRTGIQDIFSGAQGLTTRNQLTAMSKRDATRAEKLFAAGLGTDAIPATMTFEGQITYGEVNSARAN